MMAEDQITKIIFHEVHVTILPKGRLSPKDAAAYMGMTANTLGRLRYAGDKGPPFYKAPNGKIYYRLKDLDAYMTQGGKRTTVKGLRTKEDSNNAHELDQSH